MTAKIFRPTWAEVDLSRIGANARRFRARMPSRTRVLFVVKADGYGHGAVEVSKAALATGAVSGLGVSSVEEGVILRKAGLRCPILILGSLYPFESTLEAIRHGLTPTVASLDGAARIAQAAERCRRGSARLLPLRCHLKLDTGMGRIGVRMPAGLEVVGFLSRAEGVRLEGVYTHLARAEDGPAYTRLQLARFAEAVSAMESAGVRGLVRHAANSAAALSHPSSRWDMVRPGLALYGLKKGFEPALRWLTRIVFLKSVPAGTPISYGGRWRSRRPSRIATLPVGYADGYPRLLSGKASVLVRGKRCPVVGAVTMDMTMIDATGVPEARVGDEVVLLGRSGREEVSAGELARAASTISYELVSGIMARVPRVYPR